MTAAKFKDPTRYWYEWISWGVAIERFLVSSSWGSGALVALLVKSVLMPMLNLAISFSI